MVNNNFNQQVYYNKFEGESKLLIMRKDHKHLDKYRTSLQGTFIANSINGFFKIPHKGREIFCISDNGQSELNSKWEHVSVSVTGSKRTPNWEEMCFIKNLFWDSEETVIQFHPKESEYVNIHNYVLHLWKKVNDDFELPPSILV